MGAGVSQKLGRVETVDKIAVRAEGILGLLGTDRVPLNPDREVATFADCLLAADETEARLAVIVRMARVLRGRHRDE